MLLSCHNFTNKSVDSLFGRNHGELLLIKSVHVNGSILDVHFAGVEVGHAAVCVFHEVFVVAVGEVVSGVGSSGLLADQS